MLKALQYGGAAKTPVGSEHSLLKRIVVLALLSVVGHASSSVGQDASFGCKVLLCAAATSPGWSSIPYCVPVMETLFRQLARGRPFPACAEGGGGRLGREPFMPCPPGLTAAADGSDEIDAIAPNVNGDLCADFSRPRRACDGARWDFRCGTTYPTTPRQRRAEPDFVDISTPNGTQRIYFALGRFR